MTKRHFLGLVAGAAWASAMPHAAMAESGYPSRPVKLIVPYAAGGGTDFFARAIAPAMGSVLGQPVVVENRPGASGMIAANAVARLLPADGYSVLVSSKALFAINPFMYDKAPYDPKELEAVSMGGRFDFLLVVNEQVLPGKTVADIIAASLKASTGLNYASPGTGTTHDFAMELFIRASGARMTKITYKGGGPALQDLLAGHVALMFMDRATARPYIDSGKLRAIAAAGAQRISNYPQVPTVAESGFKEFAIEDWLGFAVRKGTSPQIVEALRVAYGKAIASGELRAQLNDNGISPEPSTSSKDFAAYVQREAAQSKALIAKLNIKVE